MAVPSKGWGKVSPKTVTQRRALAEKCGSGCFLDPKNLRYPICARPRGAKVCRRDCRGLSAAYNRARQQRARTIAARALQIARRTGCSWAQPKPLSDCGCGG